LLLAIPSALEIAAGRVALDFGNLALAFAEMLTLALTIAAITYLILEVREMRKDRSTLINDLTQSRAENVKWREGARAQMEGVRHAIEKQFDAWQFTPAEKDIATLILKGCSHKQISETRQSNATTVRQQAQSIYRKSGLEGRSELAAYFLDAILYDVADEPAREPAPSK
jgi:DNA-binding NarL/FixJ family response regulator